MKKIFVSIALILSQEKIFSQDNYYINGNQSLMFVNPSFAGINEGIRVQNNVQTNWQPFTHFVSSANSAELFIKKINAGVAVSQNYSDQSNGYHISNYFSLVYAQHVNLRNKDLKITPSLQFSGGRNYLESPNYLGNLPQYDVPYRIIYLSPLSGSIFYTPYSSYSPRGSPIKIPKLVSKTYFDLSSGLLLNYKRFYFGFSVFHLNHPDLGLYNEYKAPCRYSSYLSYNLKIKEKTLINFSSRYERQYGFNIFQFGVNSVLFKHFVCGLSYIHTYDSQIMGLQNEYNYASYSLGYRHNLFTLSFSNTINFLDANPLNFQYSFTEMTVSFNLRPKEQRKTLTNLETW